jgi:hypothetical protein
MNIRERGNGKITPAEQRCLDLIVKFLETGRKPTAQALSDAMNTSLQTANTYLSTLRMNGFIAWRKEEERLAVLKMAPRQPGPALSEKEMAWCEAHRDNIRALMVHLSEKPL